MMNQRNYQKELEQVICRHQKLEELPSVLLHSCCAPCSSYVLEYLTQYFQVTVFYYNPNIYPAQEYTHRVQEQQWFIHQYPLPRTVGFLEGRYDSERFYEMAKGMETMPEGGARCFACYELRLAQTAAYAKRLGMDYFTTTLSISPKKDANKLNEIGEKLANDYGVAYLNSDFKKKNGYLRSVEITKAYGMYRQDYCGCIFSMQERRRQANCKKMQGDSSKME